MSAESITTLPVEQRRGCWEDDCGNSWEAILLAGSAEQVAQAVQSMPSVGLIQTDVTRQVLAGECPVPDGRWALLVKLRGTNWVHVADPSQLNPFTRNSQLPERLAADTGLRVLQTGYQDTACATYVIVHQDKEHELMFESTGAGFGADPFTSSDLEDELEDLADELDEDYEEDYDEAYENDFDVTRLQSNKYPADWWQKFASETEVQQALLRDLEAYVPFVQAYPGEEGIQLAACHEDAIAPQHVERIDLVVFGAAASTTPNPASRQLANAIAEGDLAGVEAAVAAGASLQSLPGIQDSALLFAISRLDDDKPDGAKIVSALLAAGASPTATGDEQSSPLIEAVKKCDSCLDLALDAINRLIDAGANLDHVGPITFFGGGTALHEAVQHRSLSAVMLLHQRGADLTVTDGVGNTPLERARALLESLGKVSSLFGLAGGDEDEGETNRNEKPVQDIADYLELAESGQATADWQTQATQDQARLDSQRRRMRASGERARRAFEDLGQQLQSLAADSEDAMRQAVLAQPDTIQLDELMDPTDWVHTDQRDEVTQDLEDLGFETIADYAIAEMPGVLVRGLIHRGQQLYAAVCNAGEIDWVDLVRFRHDGTTLTVTNAAIEPGIEELSKGTPFEKQFTPGATAEQLYDQLLQHEGIRPADPLKPGQFVERFESFYAEDIAAKKAKLA